MRKRRVILVVALALLAVDAGAHAATRIGIVRPTNERGMSDQQLGSQLFAGNCATCHGIAGEGKLTPGGARGAGDVHGQGPTLVGVGAQAADFYLRTGFMPLSDPKKQPWRSKPPFTNREITALTKYVASLAKGPPIPKPDKSAGNKAVGLHLFTEHCAGCHQVVAEGGMLTGARVPQIKSDSATEIAEAIRIGPYIMPKFSKKQLSDKDVNSIIAYVQDSRSPEDRGGWGLNHIGPIPEGMVTWFIAAVALIALCSLIGERIKS